MRNIFLVSALILLLFSVSQSARAFSAVSMVPSTMVPSAGATYLLSFTPSADIPALGSIEVAMQSSFTWPSALTADDLELAVGGTVQSIGDAEDEEYALSEPGTNQLTLTLPDSASIAAGVPVTLLMGRQATFFNPAATGNHSFSVATRDADGNLLESRSGVVLVQDTRSSAGATSTNEPEDDDGSSGGNASLSRRPSASVPPSPLSPSPVSVKDVNLFEDAKPKAFEVTERGETIYQTPDGQRFLIDREAIDINGDEIVNILDANLLREHMGVYLDAKFDFDFSGTVDLRDLSILLSQWTGDPLPRATPPIPSGSAGAEDVITIKSRTNDHGNNLFHAAFAGDRLALRENMFSLYLLLDTGVTPVNALSFDFIYDTEQYDLIRTYADASLVTVWATRPTEVIPGTVRLAGGMPDAFSGTDGFLLEMEFEKREDAPAADGLSPFSIENPLVYTTAGSASVVRTDASTAPIAADEILLPPTVQNEVPEPFVVSPTHPVEGTWYRSREVEVSWSADPNHEEGDAYLYGASRTLNVAEAELASTDATTVSLSVPSDARWYIHVIRVRNGERSAAAIFEADIDATPPEPFEIRKGFFLDAFDQLAYLLSFAAVDELSGMSHYEVRVRRLPAGRQGEAQMLADSSYVVAQWDAGEYAYEIAAVDRAGNRRVESATVTIRPPLAARVLSALIGLVALLLFVLFVLVYRRKHGNVPTKMA